MDEKKRFYLLSGLVVALAAVILFVFFSFSGKETKEAPKKNEVANNKVKVVLSDEAQDEITQVVKNFIRDNGTWGVVSKNLTEENFYSVDEAVQTNKYDDASTYVPRHKRYEDLRAKYLSETGNLWYSTSVFSEWDDYTAKAKLASFEIVDVDVEVPKENTELLIATNQGIAVNVTFTSKQTIRIPGRDSEHEPNQGVPSGHNDDEDDGTYTVYTKTVTDRTRIILVNDGEKWLVHNMSEISNPYILSTWATPNSPYSDKQLIQDFKEIGTITPIPPY
jgi:hypothetical protein